MNNRSGYGWFEILAGIAFIILGFYALANPGTALETTVVIFGIGAIIKGLANIFFYGAFSKITFAGPILSLISGILNIIIGIMFIFNINIGAVTISLLFPIWFIAISVAHLANIAVVKQLSTGYYWFNIIVNIIGLFLGFWLLFNPIASAATIVYLVAFYLILIGVFSTTIGFSNLGSKNSNI